MVENQSTYRIRTKLGETEPIHIPVALMQEYNSFEILSLKINTDENYRSYTSTEGIVVGRVSTQNSGLGIPNVRVSIFVPKGTYSQSDEEAVLYPFSSPTDLDGDRVRYNLLPSDSDVECYQVIGTLPTKRKILDNETVCEVFDKYYKYTTVTNRAGDFLLSNIPVGKHRIHIDADLSDIGPFLSQKPYDMVENLGFDKNKFESTRQFKTSTDLDSLAQVISQNKSVYVYPYWGDTTENSAELKITRTDLSLNYEFKTMAVFIGSVITDKQSNSIMQNCTATENNGKMSDLVTGPGRIEMIRKTLDNKIEQYKIKGDALINDNGVWCYSIPMNLDYVRTDEYGNIIPTDDPNKGVPTRARVRFRITLNQMDSDKDAHKRCSYLVPNNPQYDDEKFLKENDVDYSFGSDTWDESFVDLFWNKVYTVKNYIPRIQKTVRPTNRKHTGIKMVNHFGDNNPFPYNGMTIKLPFQFRLICVLVKIFILLVSALNVMISAIGLLPCWLYKIKIFGIRPFKAFKSLIPKCIGLSAEFCDDGINKNETYPGCSGCPWTDKTRPDCQKDQYKKTQNGEEGAVCTTDSDELYTCVENQLAQQNEATSFNFSNDWINGCLYMPLWYRHIRPKKSFFFGLFKKKAKDQWCAGENNISGRALKLATFCSNGHSKEERGQNYKGKDIKFHRATTKDDCGSKCHEKKNYVQLFNGIIINRDTMLGQKVWYYKPAEVIATVDGNAANEYLNANGKAMSVKLLFATDIVLLGSLNDCDMNGIPKFFNYLKASTYNMPTDILFTDTEITYDFDDKGKLINQEAQKISVASGCDKGNENEYGYDDGGLFYNIGCSTIKVYTPSCINLRRICELGVGLDEMQYIENLTETISSETDELDYNNSDYYLRPDGFVSYDDIIDFDYRSMFATMNSNRLKTKINRENGVREYDFRHLYIDNFDGSLREMMEDKQKKETKANYRFNYKLEEVSKDYMTFRMGDRPYYYDGASLITNDKEGNTFEGLKTYTLPKYRNSFYFYFGLKEGKSAIDLFNQQYNEKCLTKTEEDESIPYETQANGWCLTDSDEKDYNHTNFDGYLKINLENISLPCSAVLNSKTNSTVTYTILKGTKSGNDKDSTMTYDTSITDDKICFYGDNGMEKDEIARNFTNDGYKKYYLLYENTSNSAMPEDGVEGCEMLNNGEYELLITDSEGNYHSFTINIKSEYLSFEDVEKNFKVSNNILMKYYTDYDEVAKDHKKIEIKDNADAVGVPDVFRYGTKGIEKINGTICLYDVTCNGEILKDILIEVEPYDKGVDANGVEYYVDKDFWLNGDKTQTWYQEKMFNTTTEHNLIGIVSESGGKEIVKGSGESPYFYYSDEYKPTTKDEDGKEISLGITKNCYIIKCPKGNVNYRVRVTQLCNDGTQWYKSQNYVERKIYVAEATPYKLYINDVDYDIIRNFRSGWTLKQGGGQQTSDNPFQTYNFNEIKGWLDISNINSEWYAWEEDEETYGKGVLTLPIDETSEDYETIAQQIENRKEFISKMKDAFWLQCETEDKTINYAVRTDDNPYDVFTIYNAESVCENDNDYNETESTNGDNTRIKWICTGESTRNIDEVKVPTITAFDSADFGMTDDSVREALINSYSKDRTKCFGQDNVAKNSGDNGSISIKPPYLVACVNNEGLTKPDDMKKGDFFGSEAPYKFENGNGWISDGKHEFFAFHIIDKIFTVDFVSWAYMNNIPFYLPWYEYDTKADDTNKLGYFIKTDGILSGIVRNGNSNSGSGNYVTDFDERMIFDKKTPIKTFNTTTEDSIPTKRCILYADEGTTVGDGNLIYKNYRHVNSTEVTDNNQYRTVPNRQGEISFIDLDSNCDTTKDVYGSMKIALNSNTLNDTSLKYKKILGKIFNTQTGEYGDTSLTLKVSCRNSDTEKPITYYLFRASREENVTTVKNNALWYPLNSFKAETKDDKVYYSIECNCNEDEFENEWVWEGDTETAAHFFNKNTKKSKFKDENYNDKENHDDLVYVGSKSQITYEDSEGNTKTTDTYGYGTTGVFEQLSHSPYFVVAVTENGCRAVSPVYDFTTVYYFVGLTESNGQKLLRTAVAFVLEPKDLEKSYECTKNVRNYYLTRFDFTVSYSFTYGSTVISNEGITYTYSGSDFVDSEKDAEIGDSWVTYDKDTKQYTINTKTGGNLVYGSEQTTLPSGTQLTVGKTYWYKAYDSENGKDIYQTVTFDANGNSTLGTTYDDKENPLPSEIKGDEISKDGTYYVSYTKDNGDGTTSTAYKTVSYSEYESETVDFDPLIPYFMRYNDKQISDDEYKSLEYLLKKKDETNMKFYVQDVTELKHRCKLAAIVDGEKVKWEDVVKRPTDN